MTEADKEAALGSIRGTTALEDVAPADVAIEAVTENYEVKLDLLQRVDALVRAATSSTRCRSWLWSRSFAACRPAMRRTTP